MKFKAFAVLIVGGAFLVSGCSAGGDSSSADTPSATTSSTPKSNLTASEVAEGFKDAGTGIAIRWTTGTDDAPGCSYGKCATAQILAYQDCSDVYVKVNLLADGVVVDWSNDTVSGLSAGKRANMEFSMNAKYSKDAKLRVEPVEMKCY